MRISAGVAGTAHAGPGTSRNVGAPGVAPRPTAATQGAVTDAEVKRAKAIALGLFLVLVLVHGRKGD